MMKNKVVILSIIGVIIVIVAIRFFVINKRITQKSHLKKMYGNESAKSLNIKVDDITKRGVEVELVLAIEGETDWNNLPLTSNFISKYKIPESIMPEKNKYISIEPGSEIDNQGNNVIVLSCEHKPRFFEFDGEDSKTTVYYYKYRLSDDNNLLDDIELIKKEVIDTTTGKMID